MNRDQLQALLTKVQQGVVAVPDALDQLRTLPYENLGFASLDHHRALRQGFPEVIFCEGKTVPQVVTIAKTLLRKNNSLLATRVEPPVARALLRVSKRAVYHEAARVVAIAPPKLMRRGSVLIVTAGTADIPVAEEARVTAYPHHIVPPAPALPLPCAPLPPPLACSQGSLPSVPPFLTAPPLSDCGSGVRYRSE